MDNRFWNRFKKEDSDICLRLSTIRCISLSLTSMDPVLWLRMSGDFLWMVIGSESGTARSVSSRERSSRLPGSGCFCPFWMSRGKKENTHVATCRIGEHALMWLYFTCRATSAEAGLKPKPVGAFSSSSTPLTPGLKWSSTWKRSSEVRSYRGTTEILF